MIKQITILTFAVLLLSACGSAPQRPAAPVGGGYLEGDGPDEAVPVNLDSIPDAIPIPEPLNRYANRTYVALGKTYTPQTVAGKHKERGIASWYGKKFHGRRTSSGEIYDMYAMTAAHPTLPLPSYARVTNLANQKSVVVRINDRGPFLHDRVIDLSYTAAHKLGIIGKGSAEVEVESIAANAGVSTIPPSTVQIQPLESNVTVPSEDSTAVIMPTLDVRDTNVYLQLGAFKSQESAESFLEKMRNELGDTGKQLKLFTKDGLVRVHIGPYANQSEARSSAESMESKLGFKPMMNLP